jgi:hypothetical protein
MPIELKDAVYILVYVVTIAAIYQRFNNRLHNMEKIIKRFQAIVWENGGRLNIVDHKSCRDFRDTMHESIRKCDNSHDRVFQKLEVHGEQLHRIENKIKGEK